MWENQGKILEKQVLRLEAEAGAQEPLTKLRTTSLQTVEGNTVVKRSMTGTQKHFNLEELFYLRN